MTDIVVTVPATFWLQWLEEGDCAGDPGGGIEWGFYGGGPRPSVVPGDRIYVVAHRRLRGYAPLTRLDVTGSRWCLCREAGAVAVTIDQDIVGFRGWRKRWWSRDEERPFPTWKTEGVVATTREEKRLLARLLEVRPAHGQPIDFIAAGPFAGWPTSSVTCASCEQAIGTKTPCPLCPSLPGQEARP